MQMDAHTRLSVDEVQRFEQVVGRWKLGKKKLKKKKKRFRKEEQNVINLYQLAFLWFFSCLLVLVVSSWVEATWPFFSQPFLPQCTGGSQRD